MMENVDRRAVRAVVLTPERRVLLLRTRSRQGDTSFWFTPGGGLEPGETHEQGLRRELREELGIVGFDIGPLLAQHRILIDHAGRRIERHHHIYLVEHVQFEPEMSDPVERRTLDEFRWWHLSELLDTTELVYPRPLAQHLARHIEHGEQPVASWSEYERYE